MKKSYLLLLALVFASINSFSQTVIYTNDFESYTAGTGIASQAGTPWTTWSNAPGGSEDPVISTDYALSGTNSIKVVSNNDLILDLADLTTGRYQIEFNMYVATGKIAYINLLQNFAGQNSEWATQTYFNVDGSSTTDANGESTGSFTFLHNTWINVNYIVDLDDDFASLYVDSVEIVSWKWSMGSFGSSSLHKLDALNIFGWTDDNNNTSLFYVDDIKVLQNQTLDAPTNLTATVTNSDIDLAWTAPTTLPDNYSLMRNGDVISSTITTTTYSETGMYPMNYDYMVRAHYNGLGYSASSNTATALVLGGVDRNLVLFEINTGTWCGYCPGAAMGADDLEAAAYDVAIIEYHNGDPWANADCGIRETYYNVTGYPTTTVDGIDGFSGGNATTSLFPSYEIMYNNRHDVPSLHLLDLEITNVDTNYTASVTIEQSNAYFNSGLVLRAALTESHIPESWGNGLTELNFVCQKMYPDAHGTALDFSTNNTFTTTIDFSLNGAVKENCEFVIFVQHDPTLEVVQTARVHLNTMAMDEANVDNYINVYPNPGNGVFTLDITTAKTKSFNISVINLTGQVVKEFEIEQANIISKNIDLSSYDSGIYFIRINDGNKTVVKKVQIIK